MIVATGGVDFAQGVLPAGAATPSEIGSPCVSGDVLARLYNAFLAREEGRTAADFCRFLRGMLEKYPPISSSAVNGVVYMSLRDGTSMPFVQVQMGTDSGDLSAVNFDGVFKRLPF